MTSKAQLEANKLNATKGGVKTPEGKAISKYNAQKHAIFSATITSYEKDFSRDIVDLLESEYQPQGIIEQMLTERIAIYYLKLFRIQKAETEYIRSVLDPRKVRDKGGISELFAANEVVINKGYTPKIPDTDVERLSEVYARYGTTVENRLYRAVHELERLQRIRNGGNIPLPISPDVTQMGSFGENREND